MKPIIYAIVPARSGSVGLPDKNIKLLNGKPLIGYSIDFAKSLPLVDRVFCSTDSAKYADVARSLGAEVPFLRSDFASSSKAMENDILVDLYESFEKFGIPQPDLIVWLRPTFIFRNKADVNRCIELLINDKGLSAARTICETESRLYTLEEGILKPSFDDLNKSMIRRQDVGIKYKVFSTDVFRADQRNVTEDFLGRNVAGVPTNKICGLDIDDESDFKIVENMVKNSSELVNEYT